MLKFGEIFQGLVIKTFEQAYQIILNFGPKIVWALIILLIGWVCALSFKKIVSKLLKALGVNVLGEKTGITNFLAKGGVDKKPSILIGLIFYWLIVFSTLVMVLDTLELESASKFLQQAIFYLPKFIVALLFISLGLFISQFMGKFVQASARLANLPWYNILDKAVRYVIVGLAIILALEYLGAAVNIIVQQGIIIFSAVFLIISLILLVGGKDIISSALAGQALKKIYAKGETIEFDAISGQICSIDFITTKVKTKEGEMIIPHSELVRKIVRRNKYE
ncbi:MAG: mechanosensitive ion channel domain-containing protein [Candidatus Omnitrophota bacterium]